MRFHFKHHPSLHTHHPLWTRNTANLSSVLASAIHLPPMTPRPPKPSPEPPRPWPAPGRAACSQVLPSPPPQPANWRAGMLREAGGETKFVRVLDRTQVSGARLGRAATSPFRRSRRQQRAAAPPQTSAVSGGTGAGWGGAGPRARSSAPPATGLPLGSRRRFWRRRAPGAAQLQAAGASDPDRPAPPGALGARLPTWRLLRAAPGALPPAAAPRLQRPAPGASAAAAPRAPTTRAAGPRPTLSPAARRAPPASPPGLQAARARLLLERRSGPGRGPRGRPGRRAAAAGRQPARPGPCRGAAAPRPRPRAPSGTAGRGLGAGRPGAEGRRAGEGRGAGEVVREETPVTPAPRPGARAAPRLRGVRRALRNAAAPARR